jgi:regulator of replication initiation timing
LHRYFSLEDNELNELLATTAHLQAESERLEHEARKLIDENIQVQIEARLLKEKYRHRRQKHRQGKKQPLVLIKKKGNFQELKRQLSRQRQSFLRFERRLRAKYEQPLHQIVSPAAVHRCRRIRSMPSESID